MRRFVVLAVVVISLLLAAYGGRSSRASEVAYLRGEIALRSAITRAAAGAAGDTTLRIVVVGDSLPVAHPELAGPCELTYVDNYLAGTGMRDLLAVGWMLWEIRCPGQTVWEGEVLQQERSHLVRLTRNPAVTDSSRR